MDVDGTVKTCHQILHPLPLIDANNALIEEEAENHTNKVNNFFLERLLEARSIDKGRRKSFVLPASEKVQ